MRITRRQQKALTVVVIVMAAMYMLNLVVDNPYSHRFVRNTVDRLLRESTNISVDY